MVGRLPGAGNTTTLAHYLELLAAEGMLTGPRPRNHSPVILIRSFTNACPFCVASMPALETLHRDYGRRGLIVLGVYHPKPKHPVASEDVARFARSLGVTFPIGLDADWRLVEDWWLARTESDWTSVSWILGRDGLIRYIHPGGEYHAEGGPDHARCRTDEHDIRRLIERLLAEPAPRRPT